MIPNLFVYLILISFIVRTTRNLLYQSFLWQLKEYRLDRLLAHLKTTSGHRLVFGPIAITKWIFILLILVAFKFQNIFGNFTIVLISVSYISFFLIWILETIVGLKELITNGWKTPVWTIKSKLIVTVTAFFQFLPILVSDNFTQLLIGPFLDKLLPVTIAIIIIVLKILQYLYLYWLLVQARKKINSVKNLIVVGITGSYGKTSTKEFLSTILSTKYKVIKTEGFNNTLIGVAQNILKKLTQSHQVFVVEMGAYKKGEIKAISDLVKPKIGIITGINEQHIELFGSIDNIKKTKYELIKSLPVGSLAIINGNNKDCLEMAKWAMDDNYKTLTYQVSTHIKKIRVFKNHIEFIYFDKNSNFEVNIPLIGKQNIGNLIASILAAKSLGMTNSQIQQGLSKITSPNQTMKLLRYNQKITFVDDTFNANSVGVEAAIDYMKLYKGKKILVLTPLIELGDNAEKIHKMLGQYASSICDEILLTNSNFNAPFMEGATQLRSEVNQVRIVNPKLAADLIKDIKSEDSIVVFEGKEAGKILEYLKKNNV